MLTELLEETVLSHMTSADRDATERIADALDTEGKISPMRVGKVFKLYQRYRG